MQRQGIKQSYQGQVKKESAAYTFLAFEPYGAIVSLDNFGTQIKPDTKAGNGSSGCIMCTVITFKQLVFICGFNTNTFIFYAPLGFASRINTSYCNGTSTGRI